MKFENYRFVLISVIMLVFSFPYSIGFSADKTYVKKSVLLCDGVKVKIVTECDDLNLEGYAQCGEQKLTFVDMKTGYKINTSAYGNPRAKEFEGSGTANAWQCVHGKREAYLSIWYSTGGNCDECEWQSILDLKGNRIASDIDKNKLKAFTRKWKSLGLPELGPYDFTEIPES